MIDGFRYGFIGHADGSPTAGILVMIGGNVVLRTAVHAMIATGYRVKPWAPVRKNSRLGFPAVDRAASCADTLRLFRDNSVI